MNYPSVFAGYYNAVNFAYGSPGGPGALVINQTPPVTATSPVTDQQATLTYGYTTTIDGIVFYPLNTNADVTVG